MIYDSFCAHNALKSGFRSIFIIYIDYAVVMAQMSLENDTKKDKGLIFVKCESIGRLKVKLPQLEWDACTSS